MLGPGRWGWDLGPGAGWRLVAGLWSGLKVGVGGGGGWSQLCLVEWQYSAQWQPHYIVSADTELWCSSLVSALSDLSPRLITGPGSVQRIKCKLCIFSVAKNEQSLSVINVVKEVTGSFVKEYHCVRTLISEISLLLFTTISLIQSLCLMFGEDNGLWNILELVPIPRCSDETRKILRMVTCKLLSLEK